MAHDLITSPNPGRNVTSSEQISHTCSELLVSDYLDRVCLDMCLNDDNTMWLLWQGRGILYKEIV
jgi:hypothetical protein